MFKVNDDLSIYCTRGDMAVFGITAGKDEENYIFQPGDMLRMKVFEKKACNCVLLSEDFHVTEVTEKVDITLTGEATKIGEPISKPVDYWYEVELNPLTAPQTIIGYDEDGPKVFRLFPEGGEV